MLKRGFPEKTERNLRIYFLLEECKTTATQLAREYNISKERVCQIYRAVEKKLKKAQDNKPHF